ncbi:MAG TPA: CpaD family pilus assembly lipoprotein [Alphaproteobacteria bacterium]|nr:CpaD family pilus assembly lipoprotein [Alphaproteobacteria bacterium]
MKNACKSLTAGALIVSALAFGGCAPQTSQWSEVEAQKQNKVSLIRFSHTVQFRANEDRMSAAEAARLATFMRDQNVGYGDQIMLLPGDSALAQRRQEAVAAAFVRGGLRVIRDVRIEGVPLTASEVRVVVGRHVVTPPPCPNWSRRPDEDFGNAPSSHIGCATATNLGLMIADPGELLIGQPTSPADGELAASRVEAYRKGVYPSLLKGDVRPNSRGDVTKGAK